MTYARRSIFLRLFEIGEQSTRTVLLIDWRGRCVLSLIFKLHTLQTRLPILYSYCEADVIRKPKRI